MKHKIAIIMFNVIVILMPDPYKTAPNFLQAMRHQGWAEPYINGRNIDSEHLDVSNVTELKGDPQKAGTVIKQVLSLILENCASVETDKIYYYAKDVFELREKGKKGEVLMPVHLPDVIITKGSKPFVTLAINAGKFRSSSVTFGEGKDGEPEVSFMPEDSELASEDRGLSLEKLADKRRSTLVIAVAALGVRLTQNDGRPEFDEYDIK